MSQPQRHYTLDDYFAVEETSSVKHEYASGEIFAMAGASLAHNDIAANVLALLRTQLRDSGCRAFGSDLRIATPGGLYTYPDVSVICGAPILVSGRPDTATNPRLLVEVLSDATREYDRGEKLTAYQSIPALHEILLIDQDHVAVERWHRTDTTPWTLDVSRTIDAIVALSSVPAGVSLREAYREVFGAPT